MITFIESISVFILTIIFFSQIKYFASFPITWGPLSSLPWPIIGIWTFSKINLNIFYGHLRLRVSCLVFFECPVSLFMYPFLNYLTIFSIVPPPLIVVSFAAHIECDWIVMPSHIITQPFLIFITVFSFPILVFAIIN